MVLMHLMIMNSMIKAVWIDSSDDAGFSSFELIALTTSDGLDNDNDGLIDDADSDEFGDSRELQLMLQLTKLRLIL